MIPIRKLSCKTITIASRTPGPEPVPTAPNGKVLYRTTAGGEWLQDDADISDGTFNGFINVDKTTAVEVIIPSKDASENDVTSIAALAFQDCSGLMSVMIPDSVMSIERQAFNRCSGLTSIMIPDSVKSIGFGAFANCTSLMSVAIGNSVTSIGGVAFCNCSALTSVTIPDSVTSIGELVFYECSELASVTIGSGVTSIGSGAFRGCDGLMSVTFNSFMKNEVKSMTTSIYYIFGYGFGDEMNPIEKSFTAICTDGSMTIHFSENYPATITFTDL